jgi:hypothetical protein
MEPAEGLRLIFTLDKISSAAGGYGGVAGPVRGAVASDGPECTN